MNIETSKYLLGKMTSKEATEAVIKEATLAFLTWAWSDNEHHQVITYAGKTDNGLHTYIINLTDENLSMIEIRNKPKYTISGLFDYYFDNIFKPNQS